MLKYKEVIRNNAQKHVDKNYFHNTKLNINYL